MLALAQQLKATAALGLALSRGWGPGYWLGIAGPGLVLYALRWPQVGRRGRPRPALWALSLLHELACAALLYANHGPEADFLGRCGGACLLSAFVCLVALLDACPASPDGAPS